MDYDRMLTQKIKNMSESPTIAIGEKAKKLKENGIDVISFGVGEPEFDTPENIKEKAVEAIQAGFTKYTPVTGIDELKKAICKKLEHDNMLDYSPSEIIVSCGAKHSLYNISQVLLEKDDEVIIFAPYWVTYPAQVALTGAKPVVIDTTKFDDLTIPKRELNKYLTPKTKAIILNNPCNPSGKVYSREELEVIAQIATDNDIVIVSDEIYEKYIYEDVPFMSIASLGKDVKDRTITVNGVSKTYAMTGWRIGYAAGPQKIVDAMRKLQGQVISNPVSIAQYAAAEALSGPQDGIDDRRQKYQERRDYIVNELNSIEGISCRMPEGTFYAFPKISDLFGRKSGDIIIKNSLDFCAFILDEARVAMVPGKAFGCDNFARLSYATDIQSIKIGQERIKVAIEKLK